MYTSLMGKKITEFVETLWESKSSLYQVSFAVKTLKEWYTYDVHFERVKGDEGWGGKEVQQKWDDIRHRGWGVSEFSGYPIFIYFLLKEIIFAPWPGIIMSQTLMYYWQKIFLLTLTTDSETILQWYHCIVCGLNRTTERVVNLNVKWFGFAFVLILCK